jgi:hypothetical protein
VTDIRGISAGGQILTITPSGHITVSLTIAGKPVKVTLSANSASPLTLTVASGDVFADLSGQYQITKPKGMTGTADFLIEQQA